MRKGKRRAIHIPGQITSAEGNGPYRIRLEKIIVGGTLGLVESEEKIETGQKKRLL
jgi:hypothetical protein